MSAAAGLKSKVVCWRLDVFSPGTNNPPKVLCLGSFKFVECGLLCARRMCLFFALCHGILKVVMVEVVVTLGDLSPLRGRLSSRRDVLTHWFGAAWSIRQGASQEIASHWVERHRSPPARTTAPLVLFRALLPFKPVQPSAGS